MPVDVELRQLRKMASELDGAAANFGRVRSEESDAHLPIWIDANLLEQSCVNGSTARLQIITVRREQQIEAIAYQAFFDLTSKAARLLRQPSFREFHLDYSHWF